MSRKSSVFPFVLLVAALFMLPVDGFGQGGGAGWIERFSGPGDFLGTEFFFPAACIGEEREDTGLRHVFDCYDLDRDPEWWIDVAWGTYESEDDPLVENSSVRLNTLEVRATKPIRAIELGFGAGAYHFKGDKFDDFWKLAIPLRLNFLPFHALEGRFSDLIQVWVKGIFVSGRLSGDDFNVPVDTFNESWEFVWSAGLVIDFRGPIRNR